MIILHKQWNENKECSHLEYGLHEQKIVQNMIIYFLLSYINCIYKTYSCMQILTFPIWTFIIVHTNNPFEKQAFRTSSKGEECIFHLVASARPFVMSDNATLVELFWVTQIIAIS